MFFTEQKKNVGIVFLRDVGFSVGAFFEDDFLSEVLLYYLGSPLAKDLDRVQVLHLMLFDQLEFLLIDRPPWYSFIFIPLECHFRKVFVVFVSL